MRPLSAEPVPVAILPVPAGTARPLWSVMIPAYNCAHYLRQTLASVLAQDPGPKQMQIEVVDDCSTKDDPAAVTVESGSGRAGFFRQPQNLGATRNFNSCLARAVGEYVHLLHGDDFVHPGFYQRIERAFASQPAAAGVFTRCFFVDEDGELDSLSRRVPPTVTGGTDFRELMYANFFLTPGVVVRRSFYESHGGFRPELIHTADWEMWVRAIRQAGAVFVNEPLASYRQFKGNDTGRLMRTAENLRDHLRMGAIYQASYEDFDPSRFRETIAQAALQQSERFRLEGDAEATAANERLYQELTPWTLRKLRRLKRQARRLLVR